MRPIYIKEIDEARWWEMLEVLPPRIHQGKGFLVGEPVSDRRCRSSFGYLPTWGAFFSIDGKYYEALDDCTVPEFIAATRTDLVVVAVVGALAGAVQS